MVTLRRYEKYHCISNEDVGLSKLNNLPSSAKERHDSDMKTLDKLLSACILTERSFLEFVTIIENVSY